MICLTNFSDFNQIKAFEMIFKKISCFQTLKFRESKLFLENWAQVPPDINLINLNDNRSCSTALRRM